MYTDELSRGPITNSHCAAVSSDLDIGLATVCGDPTAAQAGAVGVPMSGGKIMVAGWAAIDADAVAFEYPDGRESSVDTRIATDGMVSTFAFVSQSRFTSLTAKDSDGDSLAFRTVDDLCRGRC